MKHPSEIQIERAWYQETQKIDARTKKPTRRIDVMQAMIRNRDKIWWWSWELIGLEINDRVLSYKAPARASDLAIYHPLLVESRRHGKFVAFRFKFEHAELFRGMTHKEILEQTKIKEELHYETD